MSYEKDQIDSFITSASVSSALVTALAPYVTSNSLSAALAGVDLSSYVSSNSLSAAVATDALTVRGAAAVSATLSAGAVTIGGYPSSAVLLGYQEVSGVGPFGFSGSWSDIGYMELQAVMNYQTAATATFAAFTDGGTTPIFSVRGNNSLPNNNNLRISVSIVGTSGGNIKGAYWESQNIGGTFSSGYSATANTGIVNCVRIGSASRTASRGSIVLIGYRKL